MVCGGVGLQAGYFGLRDFAQVLNGNVAGLFDAFRIVGSAWEVFSSYMTMLETYFDGPPLHDSERI